jgi:hypothetical protein
MTQMLAVRTLSADAMAQQRGQTKPMLERPIPLQITFRPEP